MMDGRRMWLMSLLVLSLLVSGVVVRGASALTHDERAVSAPAPSPEIFAPGVISGPANDGSPTFSPDGNTLFFTRSTARWGAILESHRVNGRWTEPTLAPFSGQWNDSSPGMSPDGSFLVFVSIRPMVGDKDPKSVHRVANLWRVNRVGAGWSEATRLPDAVNIGNAIWKPSVAADGSIYFVSIDEKGGKRLYSSKYVNGSYEKAQPLAFSDGTTSDVDPEIAPDGSFLVFCSSGRLAGDTKDHLFITLRSDAGWGPVTPIHYVGDDAYGYSTDDEPHLGPDHRTVYFSSDRSFPVELPRSHEQAERDVKRLEIWDNSNSNVWSISIAGWLRVGA